ncbi:hypothetical protein WJX81_004465 [Elliptochloris bilobata]|uniref:Uncharacterized protein n=1 Tax=Elliptochloris bilobata TaxID=381761 RepID=A0AAW1QYB3_9CHLO
MEVESWEMISQGAKPWRSLLGKRLFTCGDDLDASGDDLHRCTSNDSNLSDGSHFGDAARDHPPPAPCRPQRVQPLMPDGAAHAAILIRQLMPRQLAMALQAAAQDAD